MRSRWLPGLACVLLLALMAVGQYGIRRDPSSESATSLFVVAAAAAALLVGWRAPVRGESEAEPAATGRGSLRDAAVPVAFGAALIAAGSALLSEDWRRWCFAGWPALIAGAAVLSHGLRRLDPEGRGTPAWTRNEVLLLLVIFALGAFLRFYHYGAFPDPYSTHAIEEQETGFGGWQILHTGSRPWEFMLDLYLDALAIWLSPAPTFETLRIPFTIFSALTVIPVYFLLRQLVRRRAALAGTFLYSVSSWNVIYSRCAHNIFLTNFFVIIILALLVHFGRTRRLAGLPWAGLLSGYTLYTYAGYRGTSLFVLVFLGGILAADLWRSMRAGGPWLRQLTRRRTGRDLAAVGVVILMIGATAAPLLVLVRADRGRPSYYFEAAERSLANKHYYTSDTASFVRQRLERIRRTARIFMHRGDDSLTFNAPNEPMLDPLTAVFFVGGLFLVLFFPARRFNAFFLFMFVVLMLGGAVFVQNLDVRRLQGITIFVAMFAAMFVDRVWEQLDRLPATARRALPAVVLVAAGGTFWWNYDVYFHKMADNPKVRQAYKNQYTTLIRYGDQHPNQRYILLLSLIGRFFDKSYYYRTHYSWLIDPVMKGKDIGDLSEVLPPRRLPQEPKPLTIIVQKPYDADSAAKLLAAVYPGTVCRQNLEPDNPYIAFVACDLPEHPSPRPLSSTLEARYWIGREAKGKPFVERKEPFLAYSMVPFPCYDERVGGFCTAEWSGPLHIERDGDYQFEIDLRGRSTVEIAIDGAPLHSGRVHLTAGVHQLQAHAKLPRAVESGARLRWMHNGRWELVPFYTVGG